MADPGFPIGGCQPHRGVLTPEVATFHKICMSKRKNLDPEGGMCQQHPLDPPMFRARVRVCYVMYVVTSTILLP